MTSGCALYYAHCHVLRLMSTVQEFQVVAVGAEYVVKRVVCSIIIIIVLSVLQQQTSTLTVCSM